MKQKVEIELEWPLGMRFWALAKHGGSEFCAVDPRNKAWWDGDTYILIERPKPEPRYFVWRGETGHWFVRDSRWNGNEQVTVAAFYRFIGTSGERRARKLAKKLNREAME